MIKLGTVIVLLALAVSGCVNTDSLYQITPGMSRDEVISAIGKPSYIEVNGDFENWYYKPSIIGSHYQYLEVTFDNDRVWRFVNPGAKELRKKDLDLLPDYTTPEGATMSIHNN